MTTLEITPMRWPQVRRGLLTVFAAVLFAVGWCAALALRGLRGSLFALGYAASFTVAALVAGFRAGRRGPA